MRHLYRSVSRLNEKEFRKFKLIVADAEFSDFSIRRSGSPIPTSNLPLVPGHYLSGISRSPFAAELLLRSEPDVMAPGLE